MPRCPAFHRRPEHRLEGPRGPHFHHFPTGLEFFRKFGDGLTRFREADFGPFPEVKSKVEVNPGFFIMCESLATLTVTTAKTGHTTVHLHD